MRLKRVRIFGFKTFADRTEISLEGDVIAVVGPNGCGKSNLVDAILWGLGEGNARQLRAQSSQDVIFNGSAKRKGLGYAEVTLLFDNEDGALPIDTAEVAVTRRLTRNGDNEYSINRRACRQRDVYELLADSGLGRAGYAIVGQKEIDNALNASAEDRRAWIDEAAGVQRYRQRKIESLRRLASARDHLSRVGDILGELETQREPLRAEAEVAARYKNVQNTLREVEVGYLIAEVAHATEEEERLDQSITQSLALLQTESHRAEALEEEATAKAKEATQVQREIDQLRADQHQNSTTVERTEAEVRLSNQKLESLRDHRRELETDQEESARRIAETQTEFEKLQAEVVAQQEALQAIQIETAGSGEEAKRLTTSLDAAEQALKEARRQDVNRLKVQTEIAHRMDRLKQLNRELAGIRHTLPDLQHAVEEARAAQDKLATQLEAIESVASASEQAQKDARQEEEQQARELRSALSQKAALEGQRRGIEATIDANEGIAQGPRAVLEAAKRGLLKADYIPVGKAITVSTELAVAIETALGAAGNDLIVESERDAKDAVSWLKENRAGRATFQPIPLMRPVNRGRDLDQVLRNSQIVGLASELVDCEPAHRPVIESLLGRVVVARTLDAALQLAKTSGWSRMVTLEGELIHSSGAVTGGAQSRQVYGLVQRKAELKELEDSVSKLTRLVTRLEKEARNRQDVVAQRAEQLSASRSERQAISSQLSEAQVYYRTLSAELKSAEKEAEKLGREVATPLPAEVQVTASLADAEAARDEALRLLASRSADFEQAKSRIQDAEGRLGQAKFHADAAKRRLELARHAEESREKRVAGIEPEAERILAHIVAVGAQLTQLKEAAERLELALLQKTELRSACQEQAASLTAQARECRETLSTMGAALHQAEINRTRADARRSTALARLAEDYGISQEDLDTGNDIPVPPPDAPTIVQRLRRELRAMGDVNLGAIEAFERLTSRFDELFAQKEDIEAGAVEIEKSIAELDSLTRDKFLTTFGEVRDAFSEMFLRLFGGGEGKIRLTDPDDVLGTGIELEVTLPGKRAQALNLLSGGERSLCTSAFLFGLLKVKPSPLVILDEVDAPLDGRNVERFCDALMSLSKPTQFIVITHNPVTIEAAAVWVGVSMQEPGVSVLLPVAAPDREPPARASALLN